ncbi:MAG: hypothetical protein WEB19_00485, partial [Acidimicrobiia bacterium]
MTDAAGTPGTPRAAREPRAATPRRRTRPAAAARILVAGLSVSSLFGLVSLLTLSNPEQPTAVASNTLPPTTAPPQEILIVVREVPADEAAGAAPEPSDAGG